MDKIKLGLKENWQQFTLLVLVNMMVGGMVGLERTVVPLVGTEEFKIGSDVVVFSFIIAFGVVKAFTNLISGVLADKYTRKKVLIWGWLVGLPVPFMLAWGPSWNWILLANVLLGVSQGLAWSMTVNMKIDLVGPKKRGFAMGLNEAAGYGAVGLTALLYRLFGVALRVTSSTVFYRNCLYSCWIITFYFCCKRYSQTRTVRSRASCSYNFGRKRKEAQSVLGF